jgi:exo-beta-1,3-glucanase (GH17 family)
VVAGAGEFRGHLEVGAVKFLIAWREAFTVCSESAGLMAANTHNYWMDLRAVDVDVDALRAAQFGLQRMAEHLKTVATTTSRLPTDIGDGWTGPAATVSKAELVGLSVQ